MQEARVQSLGWEDPLEKEVQSTPKFSSGEYHGLQETGVPWTSTQRSLVG